ncbi:helix-turn-helix transcriptional regulator [Methanobacterium sp.]|uniref:helix-turn-helix transcriptional regulator n=1 Tax=Methanobacterium sp. TaxID=2164 RepID=UPI003C725892
MHITDILNFYEEVKDDIKSQNTSSVRTKIVISLSEGPKRTKDLRELTGIPASTILHGINELEKQELVLREGDNFFLSEIGKIMSLKLIDTIRSSVSLKKLQRLLSNHEIKDIPQDLLMDIGDLSNSQLIEADNIDVFKVHGTHLEIVLDSKRIRGISPIFYPNYPETFKKIIENDINVELILTSDVLEKTIKSVDKGKKDLKKLIETGNLNLWRLDKDIKVAFTVTDKFMTMGFFSVNGMYDPTRNLVSNDSDALSWGNRLFEYYCKQADKVEL